jgi:NAD+ synthase
MIDELKIMLAQLNPTVGALSGNAGLAREAHGTAAKAGADLLVFPELFISGYPPEDLVLKPVFRGGLHGAGERACRTDAPAMARPPC